MKPLSQPVWWSVLSAVVAVIIAADQALKIYLYDLLLVPQPTRLTLTSFFNLTPVWNPGVSFGLLPANDPWQRWLLLAVAVVIVCILIHWAYQQSSRAIQFCAAMIVGGAIGNMIDRVRYGAVFDFFDVHLYGFHWPVFNIADAMISLGVTGLVICFLRTSSVSLNEKE